MLLLTLRGTPTIYMGEELGMVDTAIPPSAVRDPAELREPGKGLGRDPERTPFPWTDGPCRGFTTGTPWLPVGDDAPLSRQQDDAHSSVQLYRRLTALRRANPALSEGTVAHVRADGAVLSYERLLDGEHFRVVLNLSNGRAQGEGTGDIVASTSEGREGESCRGLWDLGPNEGIVIRTVVFGRA